MRNQSEWRASRLRYVDGGLEVVQVRPGSYFAASLQAQSYSRVMKGWIGTGAKILELGGGLLPYCELYWSLDLNKYVATDVTPRGSAVRHLDTLVDAGRGLPFRSESFDAVVALDVLEHLRPDVDFLPEVARVLRVGGVAILGWPFQYWLHEEPHDYVRYTEHGLRHLAAQSFEVREIEPYGGGLDVIFDMLLKYGAGLGLPFVRTAAKGGVGLSNWLAGWQLFSAARRRQPLGYSAVLQKRHLPASPDVS